VIDLTGITKKIFLETTVCSRKGWLFRNRKDLVELSTGDRFRMEQGIEIGEMARELFPGGILVQERPVERAAKRTAELLADSSVQVIFEATFLYRDYTAKADVLIRNGDTWDLAEVKSKTTKVLEKKKVRSDLIDDIAYTSLIIAKNGLTISTARLMLLSEQFRLGMSIDKLFESSDVTGDVNQRVTESEKLLDSCSAVTSQVMQPEFRLTAQCKKCDFFNHCIPECAEYTILDIPRISGKQLLELQSKGIFLIRDIPGTFRLTPTQELPVECMRSGKPAINKGLAMELKKVRWPAHYLDFETTMTAFPLYPDTAPNESVPTQYSIHTCSECGTILRHTEYLANPARDCRRELAESMIRDLDGNGSVLMYSTYEETIIKGLIKTCPDLSGSLTAILSRLVDLIECTKCVGHPEFRGSNSIKDVLPVLVRDMSYEGLPIANGDDALVTFASMARGKFSPEECVRKCGEMLRYCELDTLAMVRIHEEFEKMVEI